MSSTYPAPPSSTSQIRQHPFIALYPYQPPCLSPGPPFITQFGTAGIILQAPTLYDTRPAIDQQISEIETPFRKKFARG